MERSVFGFCFGMVISTVWLCAVILESIEHPSITSTEAARPAGPGRKAFKTPAPVDKSKKYDELRDSEKSSVANLFRCFAIFNNARLDLLVLDGSA
jgi:hypothetical protein